VKVAGRIRVSIGTVSHVLNNDIRVARDARERDAVVICELGYAANLVKGMVDGLLLIPLSNLVDYIGTLTNTSFPLVSIDHQGTGSLCPDVGTRYGVPAITYPFELTIK
jgi:DNA-binding LacI/PurR family transcriptional regulator